MLQKKQNISKKKNNFLVKFSIWGIKKIYRNFLKPLKAKHDLKQNKFTICSFYPSCSEYGILAVRKHGFLKGWIKTINRILRCNKYRHEESCIDYP
jgi:putative membrane protein insertion efficiency factor